MPEKNLEEGISAVNRLLKALELPEGLQGLFAKAILAEAVRNASSRPTPQAQMAAAVMGVKDNLIVPLAGGPPSDVGGGSEWGSSIYRQFASRNEGGYWLFPAAESSQFLLAADEALEEVLKAAIDG